MVTAATALQVPGSKRCVAEEKKGDPAAVREAFDILFGLVDHIDQCFDEVLFFADDGGSWQFGEDWHEILPPWFRVLSATASSSWAWVSQCQ